MDDQLLCKKKCKAEKTKELSAHPQQKKLQLMVIRGLYTFY